MIRRPVQAALLTLSVFGALLSLLATLTPFPVVRGALDRISGDGAADPYTPALHGRVQWYFAGWTVLCVAACAGLFVLKSRPEIIRALTADAASAAGRAGRILRDHRWPLLVCAAAGGLIRSLTLTQPMRFDEAYTFLEYASRPLFVTVSRYADPNNHVFHSVLVHGSTRLLGDAEWAVRLPAFLAGTLTVSAVYLLGWGLHGRVAGWLSAAMVAVSSPLVEYSTNARGYALLGLMSVLLALLAGFVVRDPHRTTWPTIAVLAALGFWTVPTMLYPYAGLILWLVLMRSGRGTAPAGVSEGLPPGPGERWLVRPLMMSLGLTGVLTIVLYSPILVVEGPRAVLGNRYVESLSVVALVARLPAWLGESAALLGRDLPGPAVAVVVTGLIAVLAGVGDTSDRALRRGLLSLAAGGGLCLVQRVLPPARVWLYAVPLLMTLAAVGLAALTERLMPRRFATIMLACVAVTSAWPLARMIDRHSVTRSLETGVFPDAPEVAEWLAQSLRPREPVVTASPSSAPLVYYCRRREVPLTHFEWPGTDNTRDDCAIVVVNTLWGDTLDKVLQSLDLQEFFRGFTVTRVAAFDSGVLYRLQRATEPGAAAVREAGRLVRAHDGGGTSTW